MTDCDGRKIGNLRVVGVVRGGRSNAGCELRGRTDACLASTKAGLWWYGQRVDVFGTTSPDRCSGPVVPYVEGLPNPRRRG